VKELKVKICGITSPEDAIAACDAGADFIGLIFVPSSPRYVTREKAETIVRALRSRGRIGPQVVGVFRDASIDEMERTAETVELDLLQLHGHEAPAVVEALSLPAIKAFRVHEKLPPTDAYDSAAWHMFDTFHPTQDGGTGTVFDWSLLSRRSSDRPFFLAGGLDPDNAVEAITRVGPDAIDLSSGLEESPGVKSHSKINALFRSLRSRK